MPEMYLKQPGLTYSACGPFTKNKERIEKFMQTEMSLIKLVFSDPKYDSYQRGLTSMFYKFFDKKSSGRGIANEPNYEFINQLLEYFKKRKVYLSFRDNIWSVNLADMQSLSKYNKGMKYLLCAIDLFGKYAWVVPLKDKKGTSIVNAFQKIISEGRKPNEIWVIKVVNFTIIPLKIF